ncbi:MAG: hypothetical protein E7624_07670 [Ruminococcaceae bacterium]|nr:hypothetical protein [Oscillospiraceae bacterium]
MPENKDFSEKDAFWDLESLLPPRDKKTAGKSERRDTEAVEITLPPTVAKAAAAESLFVEHPVPSYATDRAKRQVPSSSYHPQNALLHEVRIYPWRTEYDYYEQFYRHAHQFAACRGVPTAPQDFFSYMPQYTQMNAAQMSYYFWWRTNFCEGKCLPAAYSYLLLYLYEIINLDDVLPPTKGQENMLRLWLSYREQYPRLDAFLCEWIVDYSLLHGLSAPELPRALYRELLGTCRLKEFFVPLEEEGDALSMAVLLFCNNYDYTKSKFYTKESAADFHRVLRGAIGVALAHLKERDGNLLTGASGVSTVARDTFVGAICSYRLRRKIEVDFTSFSRTHELRYLMSDVLKYAENALRAARGIKSRLSVYALDVPLREALDAYLVGVLPQRMPKTRTKSQKKGEEIPAYERRYDLPVGEISPERAAEIENASWDTTKRLVEAFETPILENIPQDGASFTEIAQTSEEVQAPSVESGSELAVALGELCEFVQLAALGDVAAQRAFALRMHMMTDAVADKINTVSGDILGDIILEEAGNGGYALVEDYTEELKEMGVLSYGK